jgi:Aminotransferase class I and II
MATAIERADLPYKGHPSYYDWLRQQYLQRRDRLAAALQIAGIPTMKGEGGFFLIGDISGVTVPDKYLQQHTAAMPRMTKDWAFCRWMALEHGVIAIPTSPFFQSSSSSNSSNSSTNSSSGDSSANGASSSDNAASSSDSAAVGQLQGRYVRFCFCKTDATLDAAAAALALMSRTASLQPKQ